MTTRVLAWDATWNSVPAGLMNDVDPDIRLKFKEIKRGTTGEHVLGDYFVGLDGRKITMQCKDVTAAILRTLMPWDTNATSTSITPVAANADMYAYAQVLNLHPHDLAASVHTEDINFLKAVPISTMKLKRDGKEDDMYEATFLIYPDRAQAIATPSVFVYAYLGPLP